ncbi:MULTISPECIES: tRNA (guanosine(18)-2'-O)-methyltransferase TrmH [Prosthecochloris]|nr:MULTISPECIES: tRNA (guanosine(18)-2'-O)-methyltransferase TrmH [Prosthecochloris]
MTLRDKITFFNTTISPHVINPDRFRKIRNLLEQRQPDLTLVMDNVNKPHNLAAIIRSCDAAGIGTLHAISTTSSIRKKQKTAAGANRWTQLQLHDSLPQLLRTLRNDGMQLLAADYNSRSVDFRSVDYTQPTALIMGAEKFGPSDTSLELADQCIHIPMHGMVESLNVSVAAALILFEAERQRKTAGLYDTPSLTATELHDKLFELSYPAISEKLRMLGRPYPSLRDDGSFEEPAEE